jgi:hypothetical protein
MLKVHQKDLEHMESEYSGIIKTILRFENAELPSCPHCGSNDTADVQVGIIGRTISIAAATTKVKIVPNAEDSLGKYFCNHCGKFFG